MVIVALEIASAHNAERYEEDRNDNWEPIASAQAKTETEAKALMLENVLEALNSEDLLPTNEWLRLSYYEDNKLTKVEVF